MKQRTSRRRKNRISRTERSNRRHFFLYISPWLIGFAAFTIIPLIISFTFSFTDVRMMNVSSEPLTFIGFKNYINIFTNDPDFILSIKNTFVFAAVKVVLIIALSVILHLC